MECASYDLRVLGAAANSVVQVAAFIVMMGLERIAEMLEDKRISIQVSVVLNIPVFGY